MTKRETIFMIWALFATIAMFGLWRVYKPYGDIYKENIILNNQMTNKIARGDSIMEEAIKQKNKLDSLIEVMENNEMYIEKGDFQFLTSMYGGGSSYGGKD